MKKTLNELKAMLDEATELYSEAHSKKVIAWNEAVKAITDANISVPYKIELVGNGFMPTWVKDYEAAFFGETKKAYEKAREEFREAENRRFELVMKVARAEARANG